MMMPERSDPLTRCGIDTVEIARIERLLRETPTDDLRKIFSREELSESGDNAGRAREPGGAVCGEGSVPQALPARDGAGPDRSRDFAVARDGYGAPRVVCSSKALEVLDRYRLKNIALSLTHDKTSASAVAVSEPAQIEVPLSGKLIYLPAADSPAGRAGQSASRLRRHGRRRGDQASRPSALRTSRARCSSSSSHLRGAAPTVRVENIEAILRAHAQGKGVLLLTGHFGNWEVATVGGIANFPQYRGQFHFVRRPLRPRWLDRLVTRRFRRSGLGVLPKKGALDAILERLAEGDAVVFVFDQHAGGRDGIEVDFFGHPAVHLSQPRGHRTGDRRAGGAERNVARARRQPRAAVRGSAAGHRA